MATSREFPDSITYKGENYERWAGLMDDLRFMPEPHSKHETRKVVVDQKNKKGLIRFQRRTDDKRPELICALNTDGGDWEEIAGPGKDDWEVPFVWEDVNAVNITVKLRLGETALIDASVYLIMLLNPKPEPWQPPEQPEPA